MRSFRDIPIKRKLTLLMMLISGVALAMVGVSIGTYELFTAKRAESADLATKAGIIGADSRSALIAGNADAAQESLAALRADPDIVVAGLYTADGKLLAHYVRRRGDVEPPLPPAQNANAGTDNPQPPSRRIRFVDKSLLPAAPRPDGETFSGGHLEIFRRIVFRDETLGTVYLRSALREYHARVKSYAVIMVGVLLASSLVALLLSARLQSVFSDPILNLARLARSVTEGKDYSLRAEQHSGDEVGQLTGAFNQALSGIQQRETALRTANEQLERQTQQLQIELAERKRAEGLLLERARLTALEADVGIALTRNENLRSALHQCTEAVVHRLDAAFARIWTLNTADDVLELQASAGLYTHLDGAHSRVPVGKLKIGMIAQDRKPHLTNSVIGDPRVNDQEWAKREGMVAFAGYPLVVEDRLVGVMAMFARKPLPDAALQAMASVANAIALGIERKRAETVLRETEERLQSILDNSPTVIHVKDTQSRYVLMNRRWEILYHLSAHEFAGKTPYDLFPKETADKVLANDRQVLQTGRPLEFEEVIPFADGPRTYLSVKFPLRDAAGVTYGLCGISTDITERKRADRRLATQYAVTRVLSESPTLVEALPLILQTICETAGWEVGAFWSVDEKSNLLRCVDVFHLPGFKVEEFEAHTRQRTFAAGVGLPGRIWSGGEPAWIPDVTKDSNFPRAPVALRAGLRGAFGFPIKRGSTISGVMEFFSHEVQQPDDHLLEMTAAIGRQIGQFMERKRAEEALRQAEENYRGIFENAVDGIFQTTPDGRYLSVNPALARMLGYDSPKELRAVVTDIKKQLYVHPEQRAEFKRRMDESGVVQGIEIELYRKDRSRIWISENARAVHDADGGVLYYEGVAEDITERKRAEALLRDSEALKGAILESALDCVITMDHEGKIVEFNPAAERTFGYRRDQVIGKPMAELIIPPSLRERHRQGLSRYLATGEGPVLGKRIEIVAMRADGSEFDVELSITPIRLEGKPVSFTGYLRDITERKRAEEALRHSEERFRATFEQAAVGVAHVGTDGKWLRVNQKLCDIVGYSREDLLARTFQDITHPDDLNADLEYMRRMLAGKIQTYSMEKRYIRKDACPIWINLTVSLVRWPSGGPGYFISIVEDITARKRTEEQLKQALGDLIQSHEELNAAQLRLIQAEKMESIGRLAAGVAHEVKNPLAVAALGVEYLTSFFSLADPTLNLVITDIKEAIERADSVIRGLLDFSAPTQLDLKLEDLNAIVGRTLLLIRHEIGKYHTQVERQLAEGLPPIELDANKIEQVFVNIGINAIHAMPNGGVLRVRTYSKPGDKGALVVAEVDDTGTGIPADKLGKVFDPFFTTKGIGKGTGLGLTVAKQIVELHGGTIEIGNRPEGGARVTITFQTPRRNEYDKEGEETNSGRG